MSRAMRTAIAAAIFYTCVGIFTFGHAAAHRAPPKCTILPSTVEWCDIDDRVPVGLGAALAWPLYWSWEAQS